MPPKLFAYRIKFEINNEISNYPPTTHPPSACNQNNKWWPYDFNQFPIDLLKYFPIQFELFYCSGVSQMYKIITILDVIRTSFIGSTFQQQHWKIIMKGY